MASTGAGAGAAGGAAANAVRTVVRAMNPYWKPQRNERQASKLYHRNLARAQGGTDGNGKPLYTPYTWNVVKGDLVQVTSTSRKRDKDNKGKHLKNADGSFVAEEWLGAQGIVLKVLRKQERIIVKGVNMRTRVAQPTADATGHFYKAESPIPYSQVTLVDPSTGGPVQGLESAGRVRIAQGTRAEIPRPSFVAYLDKVKKRKAEGKTQLTAEQRANPSTDTMPTAVLTRTYTRPALQRPQMQPHPRSKHGLTFKIDDSIRQMMPEDLELRVHRIRF